MWLRTLLLASACLALAAPSISLADPPGHAPAHGYRNKKKVEDRSGGVEIVFDADRGVHVVVGVPGIYFEAGKYYRYFDGSWQVSARIDGGWTLTAGGSIPHAVLKTRANPGPAKVKRHK